MAKRTRVRTPTSGWHEIASGDIGDMLHWRPGYEVLQHAETYIGLLSWLDSAAIDWDLLIHHLPRFSFLPSLLQHQFFRFMAWGEVEGFRAIEGDRQEETRSMSGEWTQMWIEMNHTNKNTIFRDFEELTRRLDAYAPLQPYK